MAIGGITITNSRATAVDFTVPYHIETYGVALKVNSNKWLYFIKPLSGTLYIILLFILVFLALAFWSVLFIQRKYTSNISTKRGNSQICGTFFKLLAKCVASGVLNSLTFKIHIANCTQGALYSECIRKLNHFEQV